MINLNFEQWQKDVKQAITSLKSKIDENTTAKSSYGGFYIWDSKCIDQPEIMFLGINPGNGNPANKGQLVLEPADQHSYLEFLDGENETYTLAKETVQVFEMAGYSLEEIRHLLNDKSIKTNFYYLITANQTDIKKCVENIEGYSFSEFYKQSYKWTVELIAILKPKVIICEGKSIFEEIKEDDEVIEEQWNNDCGYLIRPNGQVIIGYNRLFSNIKNKKELSKLIKRFIKKEPVLSEKV